MPRGPAQTDYWGPDHEDTGYTLKYLHQCRLANRRPTYENWKSTEDGKRLLAKHKAKKLSYNFTATEKRYKKYVRDGGGGFTEKQLQIAGIALPDRNADRVGGQNIIPGGGDNNTNVGVDEALLLGRDNQDQGEDEEDQAPAPSPAPAPVPEDVDVNQAQEALSRLGLDSPATKKRQGIWEFVDAANMTHRKGLVVIPQMRHEGSTKSMFLMMYDAPGGVTAQDITVTMGSDCETVSLTFFDLSEAYDSETLCAGMHDNIALAMANAIQDELDQPDSTTRRDGNRVKKEIDWDLPEKAERYLFNPRNGDPTRPIHEIVMIGGRRVMFFACWCLRTDALHQQLSRTNRSTEQQVQEMLQNYPELRNMFSEDVLARARGMPPTAAFPPTGAFVPNVAAAAAAATRRRPTPVDTRMVDVPGAAAAPAADNTEMAQMLQRLNERMANQEALFERQLQERLAAQQRRFEQTNQEQLAAQQRRFEDTTREIETNYRRRLAQERDEARVNVENAVAQSSPRVLDVLRNMDAATFRNLTTDEYNALIARFVNERRAMAAGAAIPTATAVPDGGNGATGPVPIATRVTTPQVVTVHSDASSTATTIGGSTGTGGSFA